MAYKDLREYIARLEKEGEVQRINKEVDWHLEIGAIIRRSYDLKAPAPFFEKIKDYPEGYSIFGAPAGTSRKPGRYHTRVALSFDMSPESSTVEIMEEYLKRKKNPIKPVLVTSGPCKENIHLGDGVNLLKFPIPYLHEGDGGRYIGTWHVVITKDPDTGWVNWGMYRIMIHDEKTMGGRINPFQHIGFHYYQKYEARNKPMEFAIAFGTEPVTPLMGCTMLPAGVNEVDVIGGIRREPLELVKCETVDLEVPASSEIVLEGIILPHERKEEGPFGEYTGYRAGIREPRPVYHVKAITHRSNPILPVSCMGVPVDDAAGIMPLTTAAEVLDDLREEGFPVRMVYCPPHAVTHIIVVSTKTPYPNIAKQIASLIWSKKVGGYFVIVVEDDVDVTNMDEVIHALATRCHPERGIFKMPNTVGSSLAPFLSPYEKKHNFSAYALFDCTWPKDWPEENIPLKASFDVIWPEEIQQKVLKNWREYGYQE